MNGMSRWDTIIIGAGAAGLSGALMLGRARRRVLVIDSGHPRNRFALHMHGVLGQEGVSPLELRAKGREEASAYGIAFADDLVTGVKPTDDGLRVTIAKTEFESKTLIVASGLSDELPSIPGLAERWGTTVFHCPYCHAWEVRDKHLGVLATSPLSIHQAELIRQWSDRVTFFTAGLGELGEEANNRLRSRGLALEPSPVVEILGEGTVIDAVRTADGKKIALDAILTAGTPRTHEAFLAPLALQRHETPFGSFLAVDQAGRTSDERVWAAGNVVNPMANVPMSIGAGALAGASVNAALVGWEFDTAHARG